jgi:hypothetical protein
LQPSFQASAAAFATRVRSQNGIELAADTVESFLAGR